MGPLRGIMHAAMVLDDAPIERLDEERMWTAMRPKMIGAWNLHALTTDIPLDFFVLFSSITSIIGNPGQANYVAGNAFLDMLAYYRRGRGLPALTVNWGGMGEVGYVVNSPETTQRLDRFGVTLMPLSETLDALDELMSSNAVQATVAQLEWKTYSRKFWEHAFQHDLPIWWAEPAMRKVARLGTLMCAPSSKQTRRSFHDYWRRISASIWHERSEPRLRGSIRSNLSSASVSIP